MAKMAAEQKEAIKLETRALVKSIRDLEQRSPDAFDKALDKIAGGVKAEAANNAPGSIGSRVDVKRMGPAVYVVGVRMRDSNDQVGSWIEYGTLAARKTPKKKEPGRKYDQSKGGIRPRRFLRRAASKRRGIVTIQNLENAIRDAARGAGWEIE